MRNKSMPDTLALIKLKKKCVWFVSHLSHRIFFSTDYVIVEYMNQNTNYLWAQLNETVNAFCSWQTNLETVNYDFYAYKYSIYSENETNIGSFQCAFFSNECVQRMIYFYSWCYWRISTQWSRISIFIGFQNEQFTKLILGNWFHYSHIDICNYWVWTIKIIRYSLSSLNIEIYIFLCSYFKLKYVCRWQAFKRNVY